MADSPENTQYLHSIAYLDWVREEQQTLDAQRAELLEVMAHLIENLAEETDAEKPHFLLGGQTIILDDIATIGQQLLQSLQMFNSTGKLSVGPFYIQGDGILVNGETLVRNLLIGRVDSQRHKLDLVNVGFVPDIYQHSDQLPQVLRNFGMDAVFMFAEHDTLFVPFIWQAPDGSQVLVALIQREQTATDAIAQQREGQPDGPYLWLNHIQSASASIDDNIPTPDNIELVQSTLAEYVNELREKFPDDLRPTLKGQLNLMNTALLSGRYSARLDHKQAMFQCQADLLYTAEPLLALALNFGTLRFPEIQRALLEYSWRLFLQNQSEALVAGAISDAVQSEADIRSRRITENTERIMDNALKALGGTPATSGKTSTDDETYIVVWNSHGHVVKQIVDVQLTLPDGKHPAILLDPAGEEVAFHWDSRTQELGFLATVDSVGYKSYTLRLSNERTAAYNQKRTVAGRAIGSASGESLSINNGRLDWSFDGNTITDLLGYYDGGDAGDIWHYAQPTPDVVMRGSLVDVVQVEATPTYERLIFRNRMRIAPGLKENLGRGRGLRVLDIATSATYYHDIKGIHFHTSFNNSADDHRLRAHIRTGLDATQMLTDSIFGVTRYDLPNGTRIGTQAMNTVSAVYDASQGMALFGRGLPAVEPVRQDGQMTLALTLLRAVGWTNRENGFAVAGAQMQGDFAHEFMLMPLEGDPDPAQLLKHAQTYRAPLRAVQYAEKPDQSQQRYLALDNDRVVLTSIKPMQFNNQSGMVVRLLNPTPADMGVHLAVPNVTNAAQLNMAEDRMSDYVIENSAVNITLEPYQIVTVRLEIGS